MKQKISEEKFDRSKAIDQFEQYKETGIGKIPQVSVNKLGYSEAYAEGWQRIFGKKDEELDEKDSDSGIDK